MGRPERPLDPIDDQFTAFARDLRKVRHEAGSPTYRKLARDALFSASVLSRAASGTELPSLRVTLAFVAACGGDLEAWEQRWRETARQCSGLMTEHNRPAPGSCSRCGERVPPPPAQLPVGGTGFAGRHRELAELAGGPGPRPTMVISGMTGVGKSALALSFAHQRRHEYPDGQLYALLDDPGLHAADVLDDFLRALGVDAHAIPSHVEQRAGLYRSLLADRRLLVVLDGVENEFSIRPLLASTTSSQVLIASRARLHGLDGVHRMELGALEPENALAMIEAIVGTDRMRAEPRAVAEIIELCNFLPLALRGAAGRIAARPGWSIQHVAAQLRDERHRLTRLSAGDSGLLPRLAAIQRRLSGPARTVFACAGRSPGPEIDLHWLADAQGIAPTFAEEQLDVLADRGLLDIGRETGRYRMPPLFRLFARQLAGGRRIQRPSVHPHRP